jgi:hypothetical protein
MLHGIWRLSLMTKACSGIAFTGEEEYTIISCGICVEPKRQQFPTNQSHKKGEGRGQSRGALNHLGWHT